MPPPSTRPEEIPLSGNGSGHPPPQPSTGGTEQFITPADQKYGKAIGTQISPELVKEANEWEAYRKRIEEEAAWVQKESDKLQLDMGKFKKLSSQYKRLHNICPLKERVNAKRLNFAGTSARSLRSRYVAKNFMLILRIIGSWYSS